MSYRILVTGSRFWTDVETLEQALFYTWQQAGYPKDTVLVSGGALGADAMAEAYGRDLGFTVERHEANWKNEGLIAGPLRNYIMVNRGADICLAFPLEESKGTIHCIKAAKKAGIPVHVYTEIDKKE